MLVSLKLFWSMLFASLVRKKTKIIAHVTTCSSPAFVAGDHFCAGQRIDGLQLSVEEPSKTFRKVFIPLTEESVPGISVCLHRVCRDTLWNDLRSEFRGAEMTIHLCDFWKILKYISVKGLGKTVSAQIVGIDGQPWHVCAIKYDDGWYFGAGTLENAVHDTAPEGHLICSR